MLCIQKTLQLNFSLNEYLDNFARKKSSPLKLDVLMISFLYLGLKCVLMKKYLMNFSMLKILDLFH